MKASLDGDVDVIADGIVFDLKMVDTVRASVPDSYSAQALRNRFRGARNGYTAKIELDFNASDKSEKVIYSVVVGRNK